MTWRQRRRRSTSQGKKRSEGTNPVHSLISNFLFFLIYLFGCTGLSCSTWDLLSLLWHEGSLIVQVNLSCSMWGRLLWPGIKRRGPLPLCWERRALVTGPPGKFQENEFLLFKPSSLQYFVTAVLANKDSFLPGWMLIKFRVFSENPSCYQRTKSTNKKSLSKAFRIIKE